MMIGVAPLDAGAAPAYAPLLARSEEAGGSSADCQEAVVVQRRRRRTGAIILMRVPAKALHAKDQTKSVLHRLHLYVRYIFANI